MIARARLDEDPNLQHRMAEHPKAIAVGTLILLAAAGCCYQFLRDPMTPLLETIKSGAIALCCSRDFLGAAPSSCWSTRVSGKQLNPKSIGFLAHRCYQFLLVQSA